MLSPGVTSPFEPSSKKACAAEPPIVVRSPVTVMPVLAGLVAGLTVTVKSVVLPCTTVFGFELPEAPKRVAAGNVAFVGTGPGKWLAISEHGADLDLSGMAAVVDQSDAWGVMRVEGPAAREMLQQRLPIDLHPRDFGPGDAAATSLGHIGVLLWQLDDAPSYEIAAPRSYAGSFCHVLLA